MVTQNKCAECNWIFFCLLRQVFQIISKKKYWVFYVSTMNGWVYPLLTRDMGSYLTIYYSEQPWPLVAFL